MSPQKISLTDTRFKNISDLSYYEHNGLFKYTSGNFTSFESALSHQKKVRSSGFTDAFVVAFYEGNRIPVSEAREMHNH